MGYSRLVRFWLWFLILILVTAGAFVVQSWTNRAQAKKPEAPRPPAIAVAVTAARRGTMPVYLDGLGSVTAYNTVTVRTRVDGQLMNVYFSEGQFVHANDLLAEIDPRPFQVLLEQAEGLMARDQANLNNAKLDLQRYRTLMAQDAIPEQQLATQGATVNQLEATIKTDQASIDNAKLQLAYCRVTAPISGRVGLRLVDPGNIVHSGDTNGLLVITQLQPIAVLFTLPEEALSAVLDRVRNGTQMAVDAYNRDRSRKLASGRLLTVDNAIDPSTGTIRLKAVFENNEGTLFPNQFVNVRLLVQVLRGQVIVPSAVIQRGPQGSYVYLIKPDHTAELRTVTPGITEGDVTSIKKGIDPGDILVTDGADKLRPGSRVAVRNSKFQISDSRSGMEASQ